jgi:hypothetical protein
VADRVLLLGALAGFALVAFVGLAAGFLLLGFAGHGCHGRFLSSWGSRWEDNAQEFPMFNFEQTG